LNKSPRPLRSFAVRLRKILLAPCIWLIALLLMLEEWLWAVTQHFMDWLPNWPLLMRVQRWIADLPPYAALAIFIAPSLLLLPVKLLALMSIAHGHPTLGLLVILIAKVLGTALVARIYLLTQRNLLKLAWFARWRITLLNFKDKMIAQLHATRGWRQIQGLMASIRLGVKRYWEALKMRRENRDRSSAMWGGLQRVKRLGRKFLALIRRKNR
jgi:hypothetical protein